MCVFLSLLKKNYVFLCFLQVNMDLYVLVISSQNIIKIKLSMNLEKGLLKPQSDIEKVNCTLYFWTRVECHFKWKNFLIGVGMCNHLWISWACQASFQSQSGGILYRLWRPGVLVFCMIIKIIKRETQHFGWHWIIIVAFVWKYILLDIQKDRAE